MIYLTLTEFVEYIRSYEAIDQSNEEGDEMFINPVFYEAAIATASSELESRLGIRYPLPLPLTPQIKALCYPIAHWWAEKQGSKRDYVEREYEIAIELVSAIADGKAVLVGVNGQALPPLPVDVIETNPGDVRRNYSGNRVGIVPADFLRRYGGW